MDLGTLQNIGRSVTTVLAFVTFLGIVFWAYSGRRKKGYEEAAHIPFDGDRELPSDFDTADSHTKRNA